MTAKAVIHIDMEDSSRFKTALGNIENFFERNSPRDSDIRIIFNSSGVKLLLKRNEASGNKKISSLADAGVRFQVCENSLSKFDIRQTDMIDACEFIPAGIEALIKAQNEGFAYVKP